MHDSGLFFCFRISPFSHPNIHALSQRSAIFRPYPAIDSFMFRDRKQRRKTQPKADAHPAVRISSMCMPTNECHHAPVRTRDSDPTLLHQGQYITQGSPPTHWPKMTCSISVGPIATLVKIFGHEILGLYIFKSFQQFGRHCYIINSYTNLYKTGRVRFSSISFDIKT